MTFHMTNRDGKRIVHENCTTVSHLDKVSTGILRNCSIGRALLVCEYAFVSKETEISAAINRSGMRVL
jgi:GTP-dependent phosphoenolpyruvate carboxykinase